MIFSKSFYDNLYQQFFIGPEYLTVSSSGPAGERYDLMGVYQLTEETHNKKPVWSRHEGPAKLYYDSGKFIL